MATPSAVEHLASQTQPTCAVDAGRRLALLAARGLGDELRHREPLRSRPAELLGVVQREALELVLLAGGAVQVEQHQPRLGMLGAAAAEAGQRGERLLALFEVGVGERDHGLVEVRVVLDLGRGRRTERLAELGLAGVRSRLIGASEPASGAGAGAVTGAGARAAAGATGGGAGTGEGVKAEVRDVDVAAVRRIAAAGGAFARRVDRHRLGEKARCRSWARGRAAWWRSCRRPSAARSRRSWPSRRRPVGPADRCCAAPSRRCATSRRARPAVPA